MTDIEKEAMRLWEWVALISIPQKQILTARKLEMSRKNIIDRVLNRSPGVERAAARHFRHQSRLSKQKSGISAAFFLSGDRTGMLTGAFVNIADYL